MVRDGARAPRHHEESKSDEGQELRCIAMSGLTAISRLGGRLILRRTARSLAGWPCHLHDLCAGYRVQDCSDGWIGLQLTRIMTTELPEGSHGNVDASVLAALHRSYDMQRR